MFRRLPIRTIECDSEMYLFLLRHPDVVVNIWQVLGVSQLEVRQIDQGAVRIDGESVAAATYEMPRKGVEGRVVQVGKRRYARCLPIA